MDCYDNKWGSITIRCQRQRRSVTRWLFRYPTHVNCLIAFWKLYGCVPCVGVNWASAKRPWPTCLASLVKLCRVGVRLIAEADWMRFPTIAPDVLLAQVEPSQTNKQHNSKLS